MLRGLPVPGDEHILLRQVCTLAICMPAGRQTRQLHAALQARQPERLARGGEDAAVDHISDHAGLLGAAVRLHTAALSREPCGRQAASCSAGCSQHRSLRSPCCGLLHS